MPPIHSYLPPIKKPRHYWDWEEREIWEGFSVILLSPKAYSSRTIPGYLFFSANFLYVLEFPQGADVGKFPNTLSTWRGRSLPSTPMFVSNCGISAVRWFLTQLITQSLRAINHTDNHAESSVVL
ncbi:hypothetical protein SPACI_003460 [Sporomusa acidovorans DSM 3132]|uniref:Uncharacterized protein n=1 Tax=Sporomusa acidovorans (strain ATCC 49682 / DSM 3132 / Mol) TaxID=1123286 RepID=A0ABZ3IWA9_SPOA4|nr:hypothetical protein SPACI_05610 [Sporomusa acidovorans DSM 3132]SDE24146.1 hypothetical protein SAMN04488499_101087 [Sporomusa acidovorans]